MDIKKSLKDVIVLLVICSVFAVLLAATNSITAPVIKAELDRKANEAYLAVMPEGAEFDSASNIDLTQYTLPATVKEAKKEKNGMGYAIKLETKGYASGLILIIGVDTNGIVTGASCIASNETYGLESAIGKLVVGADINTIGGIGLDLVTTPTSKTCDAYRAAVKDAINSATIFGGGSVDIRTEEEKFQDALEAALPEGGEEFTKLLLLAEVDGIDSVYEAANGAGYVCVIGTDSTGTFIGVNADGVAVGDVSAEHKALAEAAIESVKANATTDVDLSQYADNEIIKNLVNSVKKTGTGSYLIEIKTTGNYISDTPIVINVVINAEGKIVDVQTISYSPNETPGDGQLQDGKFNSNFIGKDQAGADAVDTVTGVTYTTSAFKQAIINAFNVATLLQGGDVDFRTEEEKFQDALEAALPAADGAFTKYFKVEIIEGIDSIYIADNGAGYVCVIGTDSTGTFIGVGADGVAVGEVDAANKALAEAAIAIVAATNITNIDIAEYQDSADREIKRLFRYVNSVQITESGNYIIEIQCDGHGKKGDPSHEHASGERYVIKVSISADGVIIDSQTLYHSETSTWGGPQLEDGAYNSNFIGKDEAGANGVDTVAGTTNTTGGYKEAILRCFAAIDIIEGGTN